MTKPREKKREELQAEIEDGSAHLLVSKEGVLNGRTSAQAMQEATSDKNRTETFMMIQIYGKEP